MTIEDAIKRMQSVPSVEFACSLNKKLVASVSEYNPGNGSLPGHGYSIGEDENEEDELTDERRDQFSATLPNGVPFFSNYNYARQKQHYKVSDVDQLLTQLGDEFILDEQQQSSQKEQKPQDVSGHRTSLQLNSALNMSKSNTGISTPKSLPKRTVNSKSSTRLSIAQVATTTSNANSLSVIPAASSTRRLTISRLGSESTDSENYFVPRESWLTSLYVKLPKSKSFCRFQLELLNLPMFASVGQFLEQSCSTTTDQKALLENNSFLFALFNQFVPHNRIRV